MVGFIICHYYPQKQYGIISYLAKDKDFKDGEKYVGAKLLGKLKTILTSNSHRCNLLVFELQQGTKDRAKSKLFKLYANCLGLQAVELDFAYYRPRLNLNHTPEEQLILMIVTFDSQGVRYMDKDKAMDILSFIHFYCYGDIYDKETNEFALYHNYLGKRMAHYADSLPNEIKAT